MFIAQKLRKENIAEYLLYMWQMEDLIRAFQLDINLIEKQYIAKFEQLTDAQKQEEKRWFSNLIEMMRSERIVQSGHLQINKNVIAELKELHLNLINNDKFSYYKAAYYNALPAIVELRKKSGNSEIDEIETCFNLLYGVMLLRVQQKEITKETEEGLKNISSYIGMLNGYFLQNEKEPINFSE